MYTSHLHLVSFLFVSAPYYTLNVFHLLVSSLFVLSDVIVEDIVSLCTCTCAYTKPMVYYSNVFVVVYMYEEYCLPTHCDNVVRCMKTLSRCRVPCVSVPPILSYMNLNIPILSCGAADKNMGVLLFTNCGVLWSKNKLWGCCYVKFIAVPSFIICPFL